MGHNTDGIAKGAAYVAFNEMRTTEEMRKTAEEYDLVLAEDYHKKLVEYDAQQDEEIKKLEAQVRDLKAKLADILPEQYGKIDFSELYRSWDNLVPGSYAAVENGCKCPVMDNEEMPDDKKWVNGDCPIHGKGK
jgi:hypothetical protein